MIVILQGFPDDVVAMSGHGEVTEEDYRRVAIPAVDEKLKRHKTIKLLYHLADDYTGFTAGAMWEDTKLGVTRWSHWGRVAVVTDVGWLSQTVRLLAPLFHHPVRVFRNAELEAAKAWIVEPEPAAKAA